MKKILLLHDELRRSAQLSQNAMPARAPIGETKTVADCNCDRCGHPCPGCVDHIAQPAPELPISMPTKK